MSRAPNPKHFLSLKTVVYPFLIFRAFDNVFFANDVVRNGRVEMPYRVNTGSPKK